MPTLFYASGVWLMRKSTVPASGTSEYDQKKEPETSIYNIDNKQLKEEVLKK